MAILRIVVPGPPIPQNVGKIGRWKSRDGREGTTIRQPAKVRNYKIEVQERMRMAAVQAGWVLEREGAETYFLDRPLALRILAIFELPESRHRKRNPPGRVRHKGRYGNCDNLAKAIGDAGEYVLWDDDGQICDLRVIKWWGAQGEAPHVVIEVEEVGEAAAPSPVPCVKQDPQETLF